MIYFITNEPKHIKRYTNRLYDNITVLKDNKETFEQFKTWVTDKLNIEEVYIGYDVESNGLDAYKNNTILKIVGDNTVQYIFHTPYCSFAEYFNVITFYKVTLLGHNIKFDLKFLITEDNIYYNKVYDTMLAEQRIYMKSKISNSLAALTTRYLDEYPDDMDKSIRNEFIGCDIKEFQIKPRHLRYGASDVLNLFPIKEKQEILLEKYQLTYLVKNIEFPMIPVIAKAEIKGFKFNSKQWIEIYEENTIEKLRLDNVLDKEVITLREVLLKDANKRIFMIGGKWDNVRKKTDTDRLFNRDGSTNVLDLFGEPMSRKTLTGVKKKIVFSPNNINYESDTQIMEIFGRLEQPLLTKAETMVIPQFTKTQKVDKTYNSYQTNEPALRTYLKLLPNTIMKDFIENLLLHRSVSKAVNTYGMNFINNLNPFTNNIHTNFKQCFTETGRMSSGGGKLEPDKPNFQNIPSKSAFAIRMRNCFMAREGYSIGTHDLSGAELIIMCSLSQDLKLLEASKGDMHSHVAQNCWRRIYADRAKKLITQHEDLRYRFGKGHSDLTLIAEINKNIKLAKNYIVNSLTKALKKIRTSFKPMTFGVIYGMYATKAGKTLNISKEEGQIVIDFIKSEYPDVITMVEEASAFANANGYLILNNRTNSRAWFPAIIEAIKGQYDFSDWNTRKAYPILAGRVRKEESEARNIRIQGTQADMIKECTVVLQQWIDDNNYTNEITILSWVHDEIIDEHPHYLNGKSKEWETWIRTNNALSFINDKGEQVRVDNFPELKRLLMIEVCNRYLHNVTMDVDYDVEPYWTK